MKRFSWFVMLIAAAILTIAGRELPRVGDPKALARYRFGLGTADYLVCARCGVYLAALMEEGGKGYAVLNVNAFQDRAAFSGQATPMVYDHEDEAQRRARRRKLWTPARIAQA